MGPIGTVLGTNLGHIAGTYIGKKLGDEYKSSSANIGASIGGLAGTLLPFKTGGKVPGQKGKPKIILAHSGEWVLPLSVKPTENQKNRIEKIKRKVKSKPIDIFV